MVKQHQTLASPTTLLYTSQEWQGEPFPVVVLPMSTPIVPGQERTDGWQGGAIEAHQMLTEAQHAKGHPLSKQEIREHYSVRYFAYMQAWKRGEIADAWIEEWCSAFAWVCLHAERAAAEEAITPQGIVLLMKDFGTLVQFLRQRSHVFQCDVIATLALFVPLFPKERYSRLENGGIAPQFDHLASIYKALVRSGVEIRPEERIAYMQLARERIEAKSTHLEHISDKRWHALAAELSIESAVVLQVGGVQ